MSLSLFIVIFRVCKHTVNFLTEKEVSNEKNNNKKVYTNIMDPFISLTWDSIVISNVQAQPSCAHSTYTWFASKWHTAKLTHIPMKNVIPICLTLDSHGLLSHSFEVYRSSPDLIGFLIHVNSAFNLTIIAPLNKQKKLRFLLKIG